MFTLLALRNFTHRPWRSALLFAGYGLGVGVMVVLLSIGEALLTQARDEKLVGGGDITILPEGIDVEVMKTGGIGGLFFSIDHARFVERQLLASPRIARDVQAVAPQIEGKLLYLRTLDGRETPVRASGEIPSATRAVGAMPNLARGEWADDAGDRRFATPTDSQLHDELDRFHLPPASAPDRETWGEWDYFNVLASGGKRWAFVTLMAAGDPTSTRWGGEVIVTVREEGGSTRRFVAYAPAAQVSFDTAHAPLTIGASRVEILGDGSYHVVAIAREVGTGVVASLDAIVVPAHGAYFPGAALSSGEVPSGYVVPALRAGATGRLCVGASCEQLTNAPAYHDHNWGTWRGVTWEWGEARAGNYAILYGRVDLPGSANAPLFLYLVDSTGFRAVFRPDHITYEDARTIVVNGTTIHVPARARMSDVRGDDTLRVTLTIDDAIGTDTRTNTERGDSKSARQLAQPYFIQMKGSALLEGTIDGKAIRGEGTGFFETYR